MSTTYESISKHMKDVRGKLFNIYVFISCFVIVIFTAIFAMYKYYLAATIQISAIIPFIFAYIAYTKGRKVLGIIISVFTSTILVVLQTFLMFTRFSGFHYQFFALICIIYLFSDLHIKRQRVLSIFLSAFITTAFFMCDKFALTAQIPLLSDVNFILFHDLSLTITFIALIIMLFVFSMQLSHKEKAMSFLAHYDALTGIHNRGHFSHHGELFYTIFEDLHNEFSVILMDIDDFKKVNDTYGHPAGDTVLKGLAKEVKSLLRKTDLFARYGGEEFAVLLPNTKCEDAYIVAENIRAKISTLTTKYDKHEIKVTISLGVSGLSSKHNSFDQLMVEADQQLYKSKHDGKNKTTCSKCEITYSKNQLS